MRLLDAWGQKPVGCLLLLAYSNVTGTHLACLHNSVIDRRLEALFSWIYLGAFHRHLRSLSICELLLPQQQSWQGTLMSVSLHPCLTLTDSSLLLPGVTSPVNWLYPIPYLRLCLLGSPNQSIGQSVALINQNRCLQVWPHQYVHTELTLQKEEEVIPGLFPDIFK